jgi:hypothetical protein
MPCSLHRITLSARASTFGGIVRPICLAALRLMINSNFFGCSTGRSAGLAPLRILSTYVAAVQLREAYAVTHESPGFDKFRPIIYRWEPVLDGEFCNLLAVFGSSTASSAQELRGAEAAAGALGIKLQLLDIASPTGIESAFRAASKERADAVLVLKPSICMAPKKWPMPLGGRNAKASMNFQP